MGKQADADLILKLYDLRREKVMREARNWFFTFNPTSAAEYMETLMSEQGAYARMVITYWDMAASLDRKSTRLNSSHQIISYAVFCLIPPPPRSTLFPYTTLFRSASRCRSDSEALRSSPRKGDARST